MSGQRFSIPLALPWDVNVIRVNYRCLEGPRVYRDFDGYFSEPPVIRRVTAGFVSAPKGFDVVVQPRAAHIAMLPILKQMMSLSLDDWKATPHIHRFGVDRVQNARAI